MSTTKITKSSRDDVWIPTACCNCVESPCSILVHRVDGIAIDIKGNNQIPDFDRLTKNHGKLCPKAYSLLQKLYNPYRIKGPLKRTNPEKGIGVDPKWVEIGWGEALDIVGERLRAIRAKDSRRLAQGISGPSGTLFRGTYDRFLEAFGPTQSVSGGASMHCDMAEHNFANLIHGAMQCEPDMDYCKYLLLFGSNTLASGGTTEGMQLVDARDRGLKTVLIDPALTVTGAKADEWLPIRPGTDGALLLALIHVIVHELGVYDAQFLKKMTNSPYLVGADGYFVRDKTTNKVLIWDLVDDRAKAYDDDTIKDFALVGAYSVDGAEGKPAFQMLKDHMRQYTPEWASGVTDISASTIRRIAKEFVGNAMIGSTINIDGVELPYRPVAHKNWSGSNRCDALLSVHSG